MYTQDNMREDPLLILTFIPANYNNNLIPKKIVSEFLGQKND